MLKQLKLNLFEQMHYSNFLSSSSDLMGLLLSLTLIPKSKKTLETSLDLTTSFKTYFDARVKDLVLNVDYLENRHRNFIQNNIFFCTDFLHRSWLLKEKNK